MEAKPYSIEELDSPITPRRVHNFLGDFAGARLRATVQAVAAANQRAEKAEAERDEWKAKCADAFRQAHEVHELLNTAESERDALRAQILDGFRVGGVLTCETQTPEEMAADLVRQVREAREQRDQYRREKDTAEFGLGHVTVERDAALEELKKRTEERDAIKADLATARAQVEALTKEALEQRTRALGWFDNHEKAAQERDALRAAISEWEANHDDLVADLRAKLADSERANAAAREEQREACAVNLEAATGKGRGWAVNVRNTPLTATPLADEIARLRNDLADALDLKRGAGPTALEALVRGRDSLLAALETAREALAMVKYEDDHASMGGDICLTPEQVAQLDAALAAIDAVKEGK